MPPGIAGAFGDTVMYWQLCALEPQLLAAVTQILPGVLPKLTVIAFVPVPELMVAPEGTVQL